MHQLIRFGGKLRVAIPRAPAAARRGGFRIYAPYRATARAAWAALRAASAAGLLPTGPVPVAPPVTEWLRGVEAELGRGPLYTAWWFTPWTPQDKCVVALLDARGAPAAVARIAWAERRRRRLRREHDALLALASLGPRRFHVPRPLRLEEHGEFAFALREALPPDAAPTPMRWTADHAALRAELRARTGARIAPAEQPWWDGAWRREPPWDAAADRIERRGRALEVVWAHGDLAPWNTRTARDGLWLFDLEEFDRRAPALWDPLSLFIAVAALRRRRLGELSRLWREFARSLGEAALGGDDLLFALAYGRARDERHPDPRMLAVLAADVLSQAESSG